MATWPATLPQNILQNGFSESPPDVVIRTQPDAGPPKLRRRISKNIRPVTAMLRLTTAEVAIFDTFYTTTLYGGSLPFTWNSPRTGSSVTMQFSSVPKYGDKDGDYYTVSMSLEILP